MRRKIVKQGNGGYTVTLPIHWIRQQGIKPGDEIEVLEKKRSLSIAPTSNKSKLKEIKFHIPHTKYQFSDMGYLKDTLIIAYMAGYDQIKLDYAGDPKHLIQLVEQSLVGFEIIHKDKNNYTLQSVTEPSYKEFDKLTLRLFYVLKDLLKEFSQTPSSIMVSTHFQTLSRSSLFLRRCVSKRVFTHEAEQYYIQFFHYLGETGKLISRLQIWLLKNNKNITKKNKKLLREMESIASVILESYTKEDPTLLHPVQQKGQNLLYKNTEKLFGKDNFVTFQLLLAYRSLYLSLSALIGILILKDK